MKHLTILLPFALSLVGCSTHENSERELFRRHFDINGDASGFLVITEGSDGKIHTRCEDADFPEKRYQTWADVPLSIRRLMPTHDETNTTLTDIRSQFKFKPRGEPKLVSYETHSESIPDVECTKGDFPLVVVEAWVQHEAFYAVHAKITASTGYRIDIGKNDSTASIRTAPMTTHIKSEGIGWVSIPYKARICMNRRHEVVAVEIMERVAPVADSVENLFRNIGSRLVNDFGLKPEPVPPQEAPAIKAKN